MSQSIIKGVISSCEYETKYDLDGNEFKDYMIHIGKERYSAPVFEKIYLQKGMTLVLQLKPGSSNEVIAGYCVKEDYTWGPKANRLKREVSPDEKYDFMEGTITEKRKSTSGPLPPPGRNSATWTRTSYTIILGDKEFHTSKGEGEYLQVGMDIAVVLSQRDSVMILNKETGKYLGLTKPYFILFLITILFFNGWMLGWFSGQPQDLPNVNVTLIVINVFLILATGLSVLTYVATSQAKRFLLASLKR